MDEITAEYEALAIAPPARLLFRPRVTVAAKTDLGRVRENNEDKFEFFLPEDDDTLASKGLTFLVCDGMGGHASGQIASELACKTFLDVYLSHPGADSREAARSAVAAANRFVHEVGRTVPGRQGMGTTLSALMIIQDRGLIAQVGDSRVYRMRGGVLSQLTTDHTWMEEAIRAGMVRPEEAETHPYRHVITRAIGTEGTVEPDLFDLEVQAGDAYLLCSDGVMNHVDDASLEQMMSLPPSAAAWRIVSAALMGGGSDNTTVVIVRIDALEACGETQV